MHVRCCACPCDPLGLSQKCAETSSTAFRAALEEALVEMQRVCLSRNVIYLSQSKL